MKVSVIRNEFGRGLCNERPEFDRTRSPENLSLYVPPRGVWYSVEIDPSSSSTSTIASASSVNKRIVGLFVVTMEHTVRKCLPVVEMVLQPRRQALRRVFRMREFPRKPRPEELARRHSDESMSRIVGQARSGGLDRAPAPTRCRRPQARSRSSRRRGTWASARSSAPVLRSRDRDDDEPLLVASETLVGNAGEGDGLEAAGVRRIRRCSSSRSPSPRRGSRGCVR